MELAAPRAKALHDSFYIPNLSHNRR
ncbi:hypothetical protein DESC_180088 [Desulfosarcina cetonica]|nr:hypothetical protein DESC_180088 [Desulfosarcina cetonica]